MDQPLVSVIMPTYNYASFLPKSIGSVIKQTYPNFELIVIDNFSVDNSAEIAGSFNDKRIHYYKFANKGVIAASRNYGIKKASGDYIAFLDSDDSWYPDKLMAVTQYFKDHPDCEIVCHDENWVYLSQNGRIERATYGPKASYDILLFDGNKLSTSAVVVKKSQLDKVGLFLEDQKFTGTEDYELWLRFAQKGPIHFTHEVLGECSVHNFSFSQNVEHQTQSHLNTVRRHFDGYVPKKFYHYFLFRLREAEIYRQAARDLIKLGKAKEARPYIIKSWRLNPWSVKAYYSLFKILRRQHGA
ncbi:MAG: glycosyltransferase [Candidatus Omnitrophica bacterium]|nr:glycosyltransferase [Candidatus Omnitrophota bacterium]